MIPIATDDSKARREQLADLVNEMGGECKCGDQSALRDLLTDLRHAARRLKLDFGKAIDGSEEVYNEEIFEEG